MSDPSSIERRQDPPQHYTPPIQHPIVPQPDPTAAGQAATDRAIAAVRDVFGAELRVITTRSSALENTVSLLRAEIERVPSLAHQVVENLQKVHEEKFSSIQTQFLERDVRSEQDKTSTKVAVDAALQAQKEAAGAQNESNTKAIEKSEAATAKQIDGISALLKSNVDAVNDKIADLKGRLDRGEGATGGAVTTRSEGRADNSQLLSIGSLVVAAIAVAFAILRPAPTPPATITTFAAPPAYTAPAPH